MNRVVYVSKSGHTKKLANAIAGIAGATALSAEQAKGAETTDILFVGASIYGGVIDPKLRAFLLGLQPSQIKKVAVFGTSAGKKTALPEIKAILEPQGVAVLEDEFHCKGSFLFLHPGRPNEEDLQQVQAFARRVCEA